MMKCKTSHLLLLFSIVLGMRAYGQIDTNLIITSQTESLLRLSDPVDTIIADLESFIPWYMEREHIPGLAISLIRNNKIVWTKGFGITNRITRKPVTKETLFEVASISKIITAYIALRLVDQRILSLDKSLNAYLSEPWLPSSEYRDSITLRHVLSHSSGLGHNNMSKDNLFAPGGHYSYSNMGFYYLQEVIEHITGQSLEEVARDMVYEPLGMSSASYINHSAITPRTANGHIGGMFIGQILGFLFLLFLIVVGILGTIILRILKRTWRPTNRMVTGAIALSFMLSILSSFILFGKLGFWKYAWLFTMFGLIVMIIFTLLYKAGRVLILHLLQERSKKRIAMTVAWIVILVTGISLSVVKMNNIPVPRWPSIRAMAPASFRITAEDMATFLIELSDPEYFSAEMATRMRTPQIKLSDHLSWGLGPGIQHSQQGIALWQWGQNIDFQSVIIIYPELEFGVVVLTNSDSGEPDVAIDIAHRALGGMIDPIYRGSHLEYNYHRSD